VAEPVASPEVAIVTGFCNDEAVDALPLKLPDIVPATFKLLYILALPLPSSNVL